MTAFYGYILIGIIISSATMFFCFKNDPTARNESDAGTAAMILILCIAFWPALSIFLVAYGLAKMIHKASA